MNNYLVDTTVLVEHLRGNKKASQFLAKITSHISTVTIAELIQGTRDKQELVGAMKLCDGLSIVAIDKKVSEKAIDLLQEFHLSHGLQFLDALIAATAIEVKAVLVTGNVKHFRFIPDLQILSHKEAFVLKND